MKRSPYDHQAEVDYSATEPTPARIGPEKMFDVTVTAVIGTVYEADGKTDRSPRDAAFLLISRYGKDGEFGFPAENGGLMTVTVHTGEFPPLDPR